MDETKNGGWPSIEQFPREVCSRVQRFFDVADLAATIIQRSRRGQPWPQNERSFLGGSRKKLHQWLIGSPVTVGEKYDGTNVGKLRDGTLLGRRTVIPASTASYQRCELKGLRSLETMAALDELLSMGGAPTHVRAALYGELMCNSGLYGYQAAGLAKSWQAFGALVEFDDEHAAARRQGRSRLRRERRALCARLQQ